MKKHLQIFWSRAEGYVCCIPYGTRESSHRYLSIAEADGHRETALTLSLAPSDLKGNPGVEVLCARIPSSFKNIRSLILRIYERCERQWLVSDVVLDENATSPTEGRIVQNVFLVPHAEQPPSFRLACVSPDDRAIGAASEIAEPRRRVAPFSVAPLPPEKIDAKLVPMGFKGRYRFQLSFNSVNDLNAFSGSAVFCRLSRAGFAGKSADPRAIQPEERFSAVRVAQLLVELPPPDTRSWSAKVYDGQTLEVEASARPGDLLVIDVNGVQIRLTTPLESRSGLAQEAPDGRLILACRSDELAIAGADADALFLPLAERSLDLGDAAKELAALRPPPSMHRVHIKDISAIWSGAIARFLPEEEDLAPFSPFLMGVEEAWLAAPDDVRRRAESPEVLCLAASASTRSHFVAWLFKEGKVSSSLSDLVFGRFSLAQCEGLDPACHRSLANILVRFASSAVALDTATRLNGRLRLIERTSDALIVDLARLFGLSMDENARTWVNAIQTWDKSAAAAFEAYGELVGQTTLSPTQDEDYDLLEKKLAALDPLVSDCVARELYPLQRKRPSLWPAVRGVDAALKLLEDFRLALVEADGAVTSKVAE